jgi:hypothetical protein
VQNKGYEASLERNKIYTVRPDEDAERDGDLRVIDASGEDYLLSADRFVALRVGEQALRMLDRDQREIR